MTQVDAVKGKINYVTGGWKDYFALRTKNTELETKNLELLEENIYLKELVYSNSELNINDTILQDYRYIPAKVVENTLNKSDNKLILNVGANQGVTKNMGVISLNGVVGIVDRVHNNFCTVTSLLNTTKNINGKLKKSGVYGPLVWDKRDIRYTEMIDIPQHVNIEAGDTIVTSGHSLTFPEGIIIGTVDTFIIDKGTSYKVRIKLSNDFQSLYRVYVIGALNKNGLDSLKIEDKFKY